MVFVPILLLNMLIAMMGNTYAHVIEQSEKEWVKQWAKIVIALERAIPQADAQHYLQEYSISLGPSEQDPSTEKRGVLIIKSKSKTRAKQRKGAVANWKVLDGGKKIQLNFRLAFLEGGESHNKCSEKTWFDRRRNAMSHVGTHDLDIVGASQGLNLATNTKTTTTVTTTATTTTTTNVVTVNNQMNSALSVQQKAIAGAGVGALAMIGTVSQLTESQGYIQNLVSKKDDIKVTTLEDPFRELVINSNNSNFDPEQLKVLALSAANLENIEETTIAKQQTKSVKSLAGIFAGTETFVRKVEETIKKKYAALDPSDSEGFGGA
jgi:transient receptor potential cation channel subfamily V protein 6